VYPSHLNISAVNAGETAADVAADLAAHEAAADPHGDRAYADGLVAGIPAAGCTELYGVTPEISGATYSYFLAATNAYTLSVGASVPRYHYSIEVLGSHACTLASGLNLRGTWTPTGTNIVTLVPGTGTVWRVYGRGL